MTVAGTSAGAVSSTLHLVSPASRGTFQRAIAQSGTATTRLPSRDEAVSQGDAFAATLACTDAASTDLPAIEDARSSADRTPVVRADRWTPATGRYSRSRIWGPSVDGVEIPDQPRTLYRRGLFSRVPLLIGTNDDDGWTFVDRSFPTGLDGLQRAQFEQFGMDASTILQQYPAAASTTPKDALARLTTDVEFACEARRVARRCTTTAPPCSCIRSSIRRRGQSGTGVPRARIESAFWQQLRRAVESHAHAGRQRHLRHNEHVLVPLPRAR